MRPSVRDTRSKPVDQCSSDGAPQHFLNFLPLPQGQGSLRPTLVLTGAPFGLRPVPPGGSELAWGGPALRSCVAPAGARLRLAAAAARMRECAPGSPQSPQPARHAARACGSARPGRPRNRQRPAKQWVDTSAGHPDGRTAPAMPRVRVSGQWMSSVSSVMGLLGLRRRWYRASRGVRRSSASRARSRPPFRPRSAAPAGTWRLSAAGSHLNKSLP